MITISFIGDISLNDDYIEYYKSNINPFESLKATLFSSNYVIGNLECLAKGNDGENELKKPRLTTTVETLNYLKNINLKIATLAHNHIYDHLESGFINSVNFLKQNTIQYIGASLSEADANKYITIVKDDVSIGLLNYVTHDTNPSLPKDAKVFLNYFDLDNAKKDIKSLKSKADHVVIILHWGGRVEGGLFPDIDQPGLAKQLIDSGADLIVGHHSHTVQPFEVYKDRLIAYSLGNFCFSDYEFEGEKSQMSRRRKITCILKVNFEKNNYDFSFKYFENKDKYYKELPHYRFIMYIKNIAYRVVFINKFFWSIYFFHKSYILPIILFTKRTDIKFLEKIKRIILSIGKRIK